MAPGWSTPPSLGLLLPAVVGPLETINATCRQAALLSEDDTERDR
jgi:hypothetical protein